MKDIESLVIGYLDGTLDSDELEFIQTKLTDEKVQKLIDEHRSLNAVIDVVAKQEYSTHMNFPGLVMNKVERDSSFKKWRLSSMSKKMYRYQAGVVAAVAACITLVVVSQMNVPEPRSSLSSVDGESYSDSVKIGGKVVAERALREEKARRQNVKKSGKELIKASPAVGLAAQEALFDAMVADQDMGVSGNAATSYLVKPSALPVEQYDRGYQQLPLNSGEGYANYAENQRTMVSTQPRSTFSIDVDTGSYTNSRRYLTMGQFPPKDAVRIEEFINYFEYNYPDQSKDPFAVHYEIAPSPLDSERFLLKVGIKARSITESDKPRNLVFLIDSSGSMSQELGLVQQSLGVLTDNLRDSDRVAIVTYAGGAGEVLSSTPGSEKEKIRGAINSLSSSGGTNGSGGINLAYAIAQKGFIKGGVNRVILATDGDFNVGVTNFDSLVSLIEEKRKTGISLTTVGVGSGNYQEQNLEQLANKGNGNYFYLDSFKEARKVFAKQLGANLETVAKDVKLQIEFNPANVLEYRLVGYDNRRLKNEDFANDKIDAGEIGAGHTVTAFYEIVLADSPLANKLKNELRYDANKGKASEVVADSKELAFLQIRFKQPDGDVSELRTFPVMRSEVKESAANASVDFRFAAAVSYFASKLRDSEFLGDYSFADIARLAKESKGEDSQGLRQEFIELVENAKAAKGEK